MVRELPCKTCPVLAFCKNRYNDTFNAHQNSSAILARMRLEDECTIVAHYIHIGKCETRHIRENKLRVLFEDYSYD